MTYHNPTARHPETGIPCLSTAQLCAEIDAELEARREPRITAYAIAGSVLTFSLTVMGLVALAWAGGSFVMAQ